MGAASVSLWRPLAATVATRLAGLPRHACFPLSLVHNGRTRFSLAFDRSECGLVRPRFAASSIAVTCQVFADAFLGIAGQFVLAVGVIFYVLLIGLEFLDT